jgi:hypothetical protein
MFFDGRTVCRQGSVACVRPAGGVGLVARKRAPTSPGSQGWSRSACGRDGLALLRTLRRCGESLHASQAAPCWPSGRACRPEIRPFDVANSHRGKACMSCRLHPWRGYNARSSTWINSASVSAMGLPCMLLDGMALATICSRSLCCMP